MSNSKPIDSESSACEVLEQAISSFVHNKQYDALIALERQGVSLVHSLAVAARDGRHEQAEWFLQHGVTPNARVLRFAISKGKQMTNRILPYVNLEPMHADAAAHAQQPELLGRILDGQIYPTFHAYKHVGGLGSGRNMDETIDLLMRRGEPWRVGTASLLHTMHHIKAQHVGNALSIAPNRFNREKLLARALRCGRGDVAREIAGFGFGTKVTARVAIRAVGEKLQHLQNNRLDLTVMMMVQLHRETESSPLPDKAVNRILRFLTRDYIMTFHGDEYGRGDRQAKFLEAHESVLHLSDPANRFEILNEAARDFIFDSEESKEAQYVNRGQRAWPPGYASFGRFKGQFLQFLQHEAARAASEILANDESPSFDGP